MFSRRGSNAARIIEFLFLCAREGKWQGKRSGCCIKVARESWHSVYFALALPTSEFFDSFSLAVALQQQLADVEAVRFVRESSVCEWGIAAARKLS